MKTQLAIEGDVETLDYGYGGPFVYKEVKDVWYDLEAQLVHFVWRRPLRQEVHGDNETDAKIERQVYIPIRQVGAVIRRR